MTVNLNLAGLPAVCLPCGFAEQPGGAKLPVGVQVGNAGCRSHPQFPAISLAHYKLRQQADCCLAFPRAGAVSAKLPRLHRLCCLRAFGPVGVTTLLWVYLSFEFCR